MGVDLRPVAAYCPTQNPITDRHGGTCEETAKKLIDQYSIDFEDEEMMQFHDVYVAGGGAATAVASVLEDGNAKVLALNNMLKA